MTAILRILAAIESIDALTGKVLKLVIRRAHYEHRASVFVAEIDGIQPPICASATSPEAALYELADQSEARATAIERMYRR